MLLRVCHAWFSVGYVNTRPIAMSVKQEKKKRSHLSTKDKQTIISRWRKERKEQIKHSSLKSAGSISQFYNNNNK